VSTVAARAASAALDSRPIGSKLDRDRESTDHFWSHVAAFGALWGGIEITLGSFLHTLRLPFGGTLLSSIGAMLLVAARQLLPRRGATLCTGIVAALCKSISPGGVILGPMIAIATEGLLVELALLLAPRARLSAIAAGGLCALWSTFQKVITQVVFYGAGVIALYLAALRSARDWLGLPASAGWWALLGLLAVILVLGGGAGLLGRRIGLRSRERLEAEAGRLGT
jgi:hypothetical protein